MTNDKDSQMLCKRFIELATMAQYKYMNTFTSFLTLNEVSLFYQNLKDLPNVTYSIFGGTPDCERRMICFHGEEHLIDGASFTENRNEVSLSLEEYREIYPIRCIHMKPLNAKFSDDLTHRDFLGAIMNLGIDRNRLGDILINENEAYVFCEDTIASYITDNLSMIKHTNVESNLVEIQELNIEPKYKEITGTVTSVRLDAVIATAFQSSRSQITGYIAGGKVFVNGKEVLTNSYVLKNGEIVSVRGIGKFRYEGTSYQTKKGRYSIVIKRYI